MFNYLITIHNSQNHIAKVIESILRVKGKDSKIYAILDGCTDRSEAMVDKFPEVIKIITPDIREMLAINEGLRQSSHADFYFIMQDDVFLIDPLIEEKIKKCYEKCPDIGVLSLRHGGNLIGEDTYNPFNEIIQSESQPYIQNIPLLPIGKMTCRQVLFKSPIVISAEVYKRLGGYDERFAPIAHDDTEYCMRAIAAGYKNMIVAIEVIQPMEMGGTRRVKQNIDFIQAHEKNMKLIRELYPKELKYLIENHPSIEEIII